MNVPLNQYPFEIITGNGLGYSFSSYKQIGSLWPTQPFGQLGAKYFANVATHNFIVQCPMIKYMAGNEEREFGFIYNEKDKNTPWQLTHKKLIKIPSNPNTHDPIILKEEDGHETTYTFDSSPKAYCYFAEKCGKDGSKLQYDTERKWWVLEHGNPSYTEYYDTRGLLIQRATLDGMITRFEYHNDKLAAIATPSGIRYEIESTSSSYRIYKVVQGIKILLQTHDLNSDGFIAKSTVNDDGSIDFKYRSQPIRLISVTQSDGLVLKPQYDLEQLLKVTMGGANESDCVEFTTQQRGSEERIVIKDTSGASIKIKVDDHNRVVELSRDIGFSMSLNTEVTRYKYTSDGQIDTITYPDGTTDVFNYENNNYLLDGPGFICWHKDRDDNVEHYYYIDSAQGYPLQNVSKKSPSGNETHNRKAYQELVTPDMNDGYYRLRFEVSATGCIIEHRYNNKGLRESTRQYTNVRYTDFLQPDWMLNDIVIEKYLKDVKANPQEITLTEYEYHDDGKVSRMRHYANITPGGYGVNDEFMGEEKFTWYYTGTLLHHDIKQYANLTTGQWQRYTTQHDCLHRLIKTIDPLNIETTHQYQDADCKKITTYPSGEVVTQAHNPAGAVTSITQALDTINRKTTFLMDSNKITRIHQADDCISYPSIDAQWRPRIFVSPSGITANTMFNATNRSEETKHYANEFNIAAEKYTDGPEPIIPKDGDLEERLETKYANPENDRDQIQYFDGAHRLRFSIDGDNYLTEHRYDVFGNETHKISFADPLSAESLKILKDGKPLNLPIDSTRDRVWQTYYNIDGKKVGERDPSGYLTEYKLDTAHRIVSEIRYATNQIGNYDKTDIDAIRPKSLTEDSRVYKFYNARSQVIAEVDAEGYLTSHIYLPNGYVKQIRRYMNPMPASWFANPAKPDLGSFPTSTEDLVTDFGYDANNHLISQSDNTGKCIEKAYDNRGHVISEITRDLMQPNVFEGDAYRATYKKYDGFGQLISETTLATSEKIAKIEADGTLSREEKDKLIAPLSIHYRYDNTGLKLSMTDSLGHATYYYYDIDRRPIITIDPTGAVIEEKLTAFNQPRETRHYGNRLTTEQLKTIEGGFVNSELLAKLALLKSDKKDDVVTYIYDRRGNKKREERRGRIKEFTYTPFNQVETETIQMENDKSIIITHKYNLRGLETQLIKQSGDQQIKTESRYESRHDKPTSIIDENGAETTYEHDQFGRIKEETNALKQKRTRTYDALSRITSETDALNQTIRHDYKLANNTQTTMYADNSVHSTIKTNVFGETIQQTDALLNTTTWTHTAEGQVAKETDPLIHTKEQCYDTEGQLIRSISSKLTQTEHEYNAAKQLISITEDNQGLQLKTTHEPNAFGHDIMVIDPCQVKTTLDYDHLQQLKSSTIDPKSSSNPDGLDLRTEWQHNALGAITDTWKGTSVNPKQWHQQESIDGFNRTIGATTAPESLAIKTQTILDDKGNIIAAINENNQKTLHYYNIIGQKCLEIDSNGGIIEWEYNANGLPISERHYDATIDPSKLSEKQALDQILALIIPKRSSLDAVTCSIYNEKNQLKFTLKSHQTDKNDVMTYRVTENSYDKAGRQQQITHYVNVFSSNNATAETPASIMASLKKDDANDRNTYILRNAAGLVRFAVDALGAVIETRYDENNEIIASIAYATPLTDPAKCLTYTDSEMISAIQIDSANDRATYTVRDALNRPVWQVDPEQRVTYHEYDGMNRLTLHCQFKDPISVPNEYNDLINMLVSLKMDPACDSITRTKYDTAGRQQVITNPLQYQDQYTYTALNQVETHADKNQQIWSFGYDAANRLETESSPKTKDTQGIVKKTERDAVGNPQQTIEAYGTGNTRTYQNTFDHNNQPTSVVLAEKNIQLKKIVRNAKNKEIVVQDEKGQWTFYSYNAQSEMIFEVKADGSVKEFVYNAFGEVEKEITYANYLEFDVMQYQETGIPLSLCVPKASIQDQVKFYTHNLCGKITKTEEGDHLETLEYNAFHDIIAENHLQNSGDKTLATTRHWYDRNSRLAATCDTNRYVKRFERDSFNEIAKQTAFSQPLTSTPDRGMKLSDLDKAIQSTPTQDVVDVFERDVAGQLRIEKRLNVILQQVEKDEATQHAIIKDMLVAEIKKEYSYTPTGKIASESQKNGGIKYFYYDERDNKVAETGVPRDMRDEKGQTVTIVPLTIFTINELNQSVGATHHQTGTTKNLTENGLPTPLAKSEADQQTTYNVDKLDRRIGQIVDPGKLDIQTSQVKNLEGHVVIDKDASGNVTRAFYDDKGRKNVLINALGEVTYWQYDAFDNNILEVTCSNRLDLAKLTDDMTLKAVVDQIKTIASPSDSTTMRFYDNHNQCCFTARVIAPLTSGAKQESKLESKEDPAQVFIEEQVYNANSKSIQERRYAKPLLLSDIRIATTEQMAALVKTIADDKDDRICYTVRDAEGLERFVISPKGVITENEFDAFGKIIRATQYAIPTQQASVLAALPWTEIPSHLSKNLAQDRTVYHVYNANGKIEFTVDAENQITRYAYNSENKIIAETRYAKPFVPQKSYADIVIALRAIEPDPVNDRTTTREYDQANQEIRIIDPDNFDQNFAFDIFGNIIKTWNAKNALWETRFDNANRPLYQIAPKRKVTRVNMQDGKLVAADEDLALVTHTEFTPSGETKKVTVAEGTPDARTITTKINPLNKTIGTIQVGIKIDDPTKPASMINRAEKEITLETNIVLNTQSKIIAEQDANQFWYFTVYDSLGRDIFHLAPYAKVDGSNEVQYSVISKDYSTFNELEKVTKFATPISFDPALYLTNGVPADIIRQKIVKNTYEDRTTTFTHDKHGNTTNQKGDAIFYLSVNEQGQQDRGFAATEINTTFNSFDEPVRTAKKQAENTWQDTITLLDRNGEKLAECTSAGKKDNKPAYAVTTFVNNAFNEEVERTEFSELTTLAVQPDTAVDTLISNINPNRELDRKTVTEHDLRGNVSAETRVDVPIYEAQKNQDGLTDGAKVTGYQNLSKRYGHNQEGSQTYTQHEDGQREYNFYDDAENKIASTGVTRQVNQMNDAQNGLKPDVAELTPLTYFGIDAHGAQVKTQHFQTGTTKVNDENDLPKPIAENPSQDQIELTLRDNRGLEACHQNAVGGLKGTSYDTAKNTVRTFKNVTGYNSAKQRITHLDEERITVNPNGDPVRKEIYRDNAIIDRETTQCRYNVFNEETARDLGNNQWDVFTHRDKQGYIWRSNANKGIVTVMMRNLLGHESANIQCASLETERGLESINYADLESLLSNQPPINKLEITLSKMNNDNTVVGSVSPSCYQHPAIENVKLQIQVIRQESHISLSWLVPHRDTIVATRIKLKKEGAPGFTNELDIITTDNQCMVDVSSLDGNVYSYEIDWYLKDPDGQPTKELVCKTTGNLACRAPSPSAPQPASVTCEEFTVAGKLEFIRPEMARFKLYLPEQLRNKLIKIDCLYYNTEEEAQDEKESPEHIEFIFDDGIESSGCILDWKHPIYSISSMTVSVQKSETEELEVYKDFALTLPDNVPDAKHDDNEDDDFELIAKSLMEGKTFTLPVCRLVYLTNLPGLDKADPHVSFFNTGLDVEAHWEDTEVNCFTDTGLLLDVTALAPGYYPFFLECWPKVISQLCFTLLEGCDAIYPSDDVTYPGTMVPVSRSLDVDRWKNIVGITNTLGQLTQFKFNDQNHEIVRQEPEISVLLPDRRQVRVRPTTVTLYNNSSIKTTEVGPNGNSKVNVVNAAGDILSEILGDGCVVRKPVMDALEREIAYLDAAKHLWITERNGLNGITRIVPPLKNARAFELNEDNTIIAKSEDGEMIIYVRDVIKNIADRIEANGNHYTAIYDRNRELLEQTSPDGRLLWGRNIFGIAHSHTQLNGTILNYIHNRKRELVEEYSQNTPPRLYVLNVGWLLQDTVRRIPGLFTNSGWSHWYDLKTKPKGTVPDRHLIYVPVNGRVTTIKDLTNNMEVRFGHDTEDRRISREILQNNSRLRLQLAGYDEAGRDVFASDNEFSLNTQHDAVGNRRHLQSRMDFGNGRVVTRDEYIDVDTANRVVRESSPDSNHAYGYANNRREQEDEKQIIYDDNSRMTDKNSPSKGNVMHVGYGPLDRIISQKNDNKLDEMKYVPGTDWVQEQKHYEAGQLKSTTTSSNFTGNGIPKNQRTDYPKNKHEDINREFLKLEDIKEDRVDRVPKGTKGTSAFGYYDANNVLNSQQGVAARDRAGDVLVHALYDGTPLEEIKVPRLRGSHWDNEEVGYMRDCYRHTKNFYTVDNAPLASRALNYHDEVNMGLNISLLSFHHTTNQNGGVSQTLKNSDKFFDSLFKRGSNFINSTTTLADPVDSSITPSDASLTCTVSTGDTYESISMKVFKTTAFANQIAAANAGLLDQPEPSFKLKIPQLHNYTSQVGQYQSYEKFCQSMQEALMPYYAMPHPKHDSNGFFKATIKVMGAAAICVVAPQLAPFALSAVGIAAGTGATAIATGFSAAVLSAATQGVEMKLGIQSNFSFNEMLETGLTAGIGDYNLTSAAKTTAAVKAFNAVKSASEVAVSSQLIEMQIGTRDRFDMHMVLAAASSSLIGSQINININGMPVASQAAQNTATAITGAGVNSLLYHQDPQLDQVLADALGTQMGQMTGSQIASRLPTRTPNRVNDDVASQRNQAQKNELVGHDAVAAQKVRNAQYQADTHDSSWGQKAEQKVGEVSALKTKSTTKNYLDTSRNRLLLRNKLFGNSINSGKSDSNESNLESNASAPRFKEDFSHEIGSAGTWVTATLDHYEESGKELGPRYQKLQTYYETKAIKSWNNMRSMESNARTFVDVKAVQAEKIHVKQNFSKASRYGFYASTQKGLVLAGKAAGVYEIGGAAYEVYNAKAPDRKIVAYEQVGKIIGGKVGAFLVGGAVGGLVESIAPVISTPIAIAARVVGGSAGAAFGKFAGHKVYETQEEVEKWYNNRHSR